MTAPKADITQLDARAMLLAIKLNNSKDVTARLARGFPPDARLPGSHQLTGLMLAAHIGLPHIVEAFLSAGARVGIASESGNNALHEAVSVADNLTCVKCMALLIDAGGHVDARNEKGVSVLGTAITEAQWATETQNIIMDYTPVVQLLLDAGADPALLGKQELEILRTTAENFLDEGMIGKLLAHVQQDTLERGTSTVGRGVVPRRI
jgi:ankyrin repeat protein